MPKHGGKQNVADQRELSKTLQSVANVGLRQESRDGGERDSSSLNGKRCRMCKALASTVTCGLCRYGDTPNPHSRNTVNVRSAPKDLGKGQQPACVVETDHNDHEVVACEAGTSMSALMIMVQAQ
eukprot:1177626-Amphidinium_carterae.1